MARFNASVEGTNKVTNRDGGPAYKITDVKEKLVREVLASLWSPKYYGDTNGAIIQDTKALLGQGEVDFICKLAVFARKEGLEGHARSVLSRFEKP